MRVHFWLNNHNEMAHHRIIIPARGLEREGYRVTVGGLEEGLEADAIIAQNQPTDEFNYWVYVLRQAGMPVFIDRPSGKSHPKALERATEVIEFPTMVEQWQVDFTPRQKAQPVVGWVGTRDKDIEGIRLLVRRLHRKYGVQFRSIGIDNQAGLPDDAYKFMYKPNSHDDYYRLLNFDVALLPLADNGVKASTTNTLLVEYAAAGVPVVGNEGPGTDFLEYGANGYTVGANESRDWGRGLDRLLGDPDHREEMSQAAKRMAEARTIEYNLYRYEQLLFEHMSLGGPKRRRLIEKVDNLTKELAQG